MSNFHMIWNDVPVEPLLEQIAQSPYLWNTNSVRTSQLATVHYDVDDIILRYPGRGLENWNLDPFSLLTEAQSIVFRLMGHVWGELLGRVVISRLAPGKLIPPHTDRLSVGIPMFYSRYQIPLQGEPGVEFYCGGEQLYMEPGCAYWFDNTIEHSVINDSRADRISMIVDIRTFAPV